MFVRAGAESCQVLHFVQNDKGGSRRTRAKAARAYAAGYDQVAFAEYNSSLKSYVLRLTP